MADQYVQVAPDGAGKKIDTSELTVNSQTVERQRVVIGGDQDAGSFLKPNADGSIVADIIGQLKELVYAVRQIVDQPFVDPLGTGALRITGSAAVSGSLTTVTTVTGITNIGSTPANGLVLDAMDTAWYQSVRRCIA